MSRVIVRPLIVQRDEYILRCLCLLTFVFVVPTCVGERRVRVAVHPLYEYKHAIGNLECCCNATSRLLEGEQVRCRWDRGLGCSCRSSQGGRPIDLCRGIFIVPVILRRFCAFESALITETSLSGVHCRAPVCARPRRRPKPERGGRLCRLVYTTFTDDA